MATKTRVVTTTVNGVVVETQTATFNTTPEQDVEETLANQATAALTANKTYAALASPSNAQVAAQVKALTQQVNALIRLQLRRLDTAD